MDTELVVSICAVVIALTALGVSFWQGFIQYKHQKLSVTPHLFFEVDSRETTNFKVSLRSNGLGPAKVADYFWEVNDKFYPIRTSDDFKKILYELKLTDLLSEFYIPDVGKYIESGSNGFIIHFPNTENKDDNIYIAKKLKSVNFHIDYESIYGEKFSEKYSVMGSPLSLRTV